MPQFVERECVCYQWLWGTSLVLTLVNGVLTMLRVLCSPYEVPRKNLSVQRHCLRKKNIRTSEAEAGMAGSSRSTLGSSHHVCSPPFPTTSMILVFAGAILFALLNIAQSDSSSSFRLRFRHDKGQFKIVQVADMHYANGAITACENVLPSQEASCSDLNTTAFLNRMIAAEQPDMLIFTGDNIFGYDCNDSATSQTAAFAPAVTARIPWAAVLGNHDQEGSLNREQLMEQIAQMRYSLAQVNPSSFDGDGRSCNSILSSIDGFGNYNLEIGGAVGSQMENKSVLNLYFLDSGDYSTVPSIGGYGWIKPSQQVWFSQTSARLQAAYKSSPVPQNNSAPGLVYFHIPLPEFSLFDASNMTGIKQENISSPSINSGFFTTMVEAADVKAAFVGHDHINDFCGDLMGVKLCYAGGFGYHAYGLAGWSRRSRVVVASLEKDGNGGWAGVSQISTWKRLDDASLSVIDKQILWS